MKPTLVAFALLAAGPAQAHVTFEQAQALAGKPYKAVLRVGHGCDGSPTREIRVHLPAGVRGAKPMPKPGWTLEIHRAPLAEAYESHGQRVSEDVDEIVWRARSAEHELDDAHYDEFVFRATLPASPGTLWFPVLQICRRGAWRWEAVPQPDQPLPRAPAVRLDLLAAPAAAPHAH